MGKSTSCFKLITCGGDAADKDDYHQVAEVIASSIQLNHSNSLLSACLIPPSFSSSSSSSSSSSPIHVLGLSSASAIRQSLPSPSISFTPSLLFFFSFFDSLLKASTM